MNYEYDYMGNLLKETNSLIQYPSENVYDLKGRLIKKTERKTDGSEIVTSYTYDILDRLIKEQNSALTKFYYDNNGNTVKTDFDGTITENTYNSRNMLIKTNAENMLITNYTYDPAGNMLTLNNSGISTAYEYNSLGQMTKLTDNAGNSEVYT